MVFEGLLVEVLNRFLGPYVKNLDASQLKVGIWGGDVLLNKLEIKENALDDLNLPIRILGGHLDKLRLQIPWKNLYSAPVIAEVEGLYVVAGPASAVSYDPKKAASELRDKKNKQLQMVEAARKTSKESAKKKNDPGFVEKLVTQIIKNVQITVKNIHVCYEDSVTNPSSPFSCGVTLDSLFVQSTNSEYGINGVSSSDSPTSFLIYKLVQMSCLSVYLNSNSDLVSKDLPDNWTDIFIRRIARPDFTPSDRQYVVHPISAEAKLQLTMKPGEDLDVPQALVSLVLDQITIALKKEQYQDIMSFVESLDRMSINMKYLKYKPDASLHQDKKGWWKYAITAVLEEDVKRRTRMWSWKHIKEHREKCKKYTELYAKKLLTPKKVPKDLQTQLDELEGELDVFNITWCRQVANSKVEKQQEKDAAASAKKGWVSWATSWVTGGKEDAPVDIKPPTEEEMQAEKEKLYQALDYSEGAKVASYPKEYVTQRMQFQLNRVSLKLSNEEGSVADVITSEVGVNVALRSAAGGVGVSLSVGSLSMTGSSVGQEAPQIITTKADGPLLNVEFDLNPLESRADQRLRVRLEALQLLHDNETVDAIIGMFLLPKDVQLQKISAGAASTLKDLKTQTRAGLEHVVDKRKILDVDISVKSPYLLIPQQNGGLQKAENILVVDLGLLTVTSDMQHIVPDVRHASIEELKEAAYDHFNLSLTNFQVIVARTSDDWKGACNQAKSPFHILRPAKLDLGLHKSVLPDDTNLPSFKVNGKLPELLLALSDKKTKQVLEIVQSLSPPPSLANRPKESKYSYNEVKPASMDTDDVLEAISSTTLLETSDSGSSSDDEWFDADEGEYSEVTHSYVPVKYGDLSIPEKQKNVDSRTTSTDKDDTSVSSASATKLLLSFDIDRVGIFFSEQSELDDSETPRLNFDLHGVSTVVEVKTWEMCVGASLNFMVIEDHYGNTNQITQMLVAGKKDGSEKFLDFRYKKHDTSAPQYTTTFQSTQQKIGVKVTTIAVNLSGDSLASLITIGKDIAKILETDSSNAVSESSAAVSESSFSAEDKVSESLLPTEDKGETKSSVPGERSLHLSAELEGLKFTLSDSSGDLLSSNLKSLGAELDVFENRTEISVSVTSFSVMDKDLECCHSDVISCVNPNQKIVDAKVTLYKNIDQHDLDCADLSISASVQRLQVTVVFRFLNRIKNFSTRFLKQLELDQKTIDSAKEAATKTASRTAVALKERSSSRVQLSVFVDAPVLVLPLSATSYSTIILDLGLLTLNNKFTSPCSAVGDNVTTKTAIVSPSGMPAVVDQLEVSISSIQIGRTDSSTKVEEGVFLDHMILKPLEFRGVVKRSLSGWCSSVPAVNIEANLKAMEVLFSPEDFKAVMELVDSIDDGKEEEEEEGEKGKDKDDEESAKDSVEDTPDKGKGEEEEEEEAESANEGKWTGDEGGASNEIRVLATIGTVKLLLHSSAYQKLASISVEEFSTDVQLLLPNQIALSASISDIVITDLSPKTSIYPKIMSVAEGRKALTTKVLIYPQATKTPLGAQDTSKHDLSVSASLGQLRVTLLFLFINRVLSCIKQFDLSKGVKESARESAKTASKKASEVVQEQHKNGTRIKLDISIDAPEVIIPLRSDSSKVIVADLGKLTLSNAFHLVEVAHSKDVAIVESYDIKLSNLKVSRTETDYLGLGDSDKTHSTILTPFNLSTAVKRNLSASWYHSIPSIDLTANLETLKMVASGDDIESMCQIVSGNLKEGSTGDSRRRKDDLIEGDESGDSGEEAETKGDGDGSEDKEEAFTSVLISASMHSIQIELYKKSKLASDGLASLNISQLKAFTKVESNGAMETSLSIDNCFLDNKQPDARISTSRLIKQSLIISAEETTPSLINLQYTKTEWNESRLSTRLNGIQVMVDMHFIMTLLDFVKTSTRPLTSPPEVPMGADTPDFQEDTSATSRDQTPEPRVPASRHSSSSLKEERPSSQSKMVITAQVKQPLIALLEHTTNANPRALVLQTELKVNMTEAQNRSINATISSLEMTSTRISNLRSTSTKVLEPITSPLWASLSAFNGTTDIKAEVPSLSLIVSPSTVRLILSVCETFKTSSEEEEVIADTFPPDLWKPRQLDKSRWYFRPSKEVVEVPEEGDSVDAPPTPTIPVNESMKLLVESVSISVEQDMPSGRALPVIMINMGGKERKAFDMTVQNWSSMLQATAYTSMMVSYYSIVRDCWEPILEPVMDPKDDEAPPVMWFMNISIEKQPSTVRRSSTITPGEVDFRRSSTASTVSLPATSDANRKTGENPPELKIQLSTKNALQLTLTKTSLGLVSDLLEAYMKKADDLRIEEDGEVEEVDTYVPEMYQPIYTIKNMLGDGITFKIEGKRNIKVHGGASPVIQQGQKVDLFHVGKIKGVKPGEVLPRNSHLMRVHVITLMIPGFRPVDVVLASNDHTTYSLTSLATLGAMASSSRFWGDKDKEKPKLPTKVGIVVDIDRRSKSKTPQVCVRSSMKVVNKLEESVHVCVVADEVDLPSGTSSSPLLKTGEELYLPLEYVGKENAAIYFKPDKENAKWSREPLLLKEGVGSKDVVSVISGGNQYYYIHVLIEEEANKKTQGSISDHSSKSFSLHYPLLFQNVLPLPFRIVEKKHNETVLLEPGEKIHFSCADLEDGTTFKATLTYAGIDWSGDFSVGPRTEGQFSFTLKPLRETSVDDDMNLNLLASSDISLFVSKEISQTWLLSVFCPYWIINKTDFTLQYSETKTGPVTTHPPDIPIALYPKNKAQVRILGEGQEVTDWSNTFSLDTAGSEGIFHCTDTTKNKEYQMGSAVQISSVGLSKMITISPRFLAYNKTKDHITLTVRDDKSDSFSLVSEELAPFWPSGEAEWMLVSMVVMEETVVSLPFKFKENSSLLLRLGEAFGLVVEVQVTGSANVLTFFPYYVGAVPFQLINDTGYNVEYKQAIELGSGVHTLLPGMSVMYTWDDPAQDRQMEVMIDDFKKGKTRVRIGPKDGSGRFSVRSSTSSMGSSVSSLGGTSDQEEGRSKLPSIKEDGDPEESEEDDQEDTSPKKEATGEEVFEEFESEEEEEEEVKEENSEGGCDEVDTGMFRRVSKSIGKKVGKTGRKIGETVSKTVHKPVDLIRKRSSKNMIKEKVYWVSFHDGFQRVLLITTDPMLTQHISEGNKYEQVHLNIILSLQSVGLSLVNDVLGLEVAYIGIAHSNPIWEEQKRWNRYKAVPNALKALLEDEYQKAKEAKSKGEITIPGTELRVDFSDLQNIVLKEKKGRKIKKLRRSRYEGVFFDISFSANQTCIKASINAIQVDNHLPYSANPTILFPYPLPPAVASKFAPKPFIEASAIIRSSEQSKAKEIEFLQVLVQELGVNVDMSFIMATFDILSDLQSSKTKTILIEENIAKAKQPLKESEVTQVSAVARRDYFKMLHLSPLDVHLSFSLNRDQDLSSKPMTVSNTHPVFSIIISALTQFGILIGQTKGAELKLGYFQLEEVALTHAMLTNRITKHYIQQAALQMYRIVLGLEVLGNPVGFIVGLKDGAIGLFYQPIQGAVLGPGEFLEGLALGGRQFFGGTFGGVAGVAGKVTGVLADAVAKLSFDSEYQQDRRKASGTIGDGVEGAAKGVFAGFTGVFTQPIKGAKEGGLVGFFKGAGKGAVGILVRPAAGIIDLASASFKTIQKKTQVGENEVSQVRPARYIGPDKIVYPYSPNKAIGYALFLQLNNGKLAESDYFFDYVELVEDPLKAILITSNCFALVKHVHTPISDKFEDEFTFRFHELEGPVKTKNNTLLTFLRESSGFPRLGLIGKSKKDVVTRTLTVDTIELADKIKALINQAFDQYKSTMD